MMSYPSSRSSIDKLPMVILTTEEGDIMTEFIQALLILSFTIIALVSIVHGKEFSTKVDKKDDSLQAEISVTEDNDIKRKK